MICYLENKTEITSIMLLAFPIFYSVPSFNLAFFSKCSPCPSPLTEQVSGGGAVFNVVSTGTRKKVNNHHFCDEVTNLGAGAQK
jgi:hypothetical protein